MQLLVNVRRYTLLMNKIFVYRTKTINDNFLKITIMNQTDFWTYTCRLSRLSNVLFYVFILYCLRMTSLFVYCNVDRSTFSNVDRWRHTSHYIYFCWPGVDQSRSSILVSGITIVIIWYNLWYTLMLLKKCRNISQSELNRFLICHTLSALHLSI